MPERTNKYPDYVRYVVQQLKSFCPMLGRHKIADVLARAGLHLSASTVIYTAEVSTPSLKDTNTSMMEISLTSTTDDFLYSEYQSILEYIFAHFPREI